MKNTSTFFANYTIGSNAYESVSNVCGLYGKKIAMIAGDKSKVAVLDKLSKALEKSDLSITTVIQYGHECCRTNMDKCIKLLEENPVDMIFAVGGGKAIDTAKGVAHLLNLPVFAFPTIAATCAATTALSVVYKDDGSYDQIYYYDRPPLHAFIDLEILASAPEKYLRAGIGDTLGKYFECHFAARGETLHHGSGLAREISNMCYTPLLENGAKAMEDAVANVVSEALCETVLAIVVSTGLVSLLVEDQYNGAIAHSVYYGMVLLEGFEEENLHGDVVGYGVLVQLAIDGNQEDMKKVYEFLKAVGIRTKLSEMKAVVTPEVLTAIVKGPDMDQIPYPVTEEMVAKAMDQVERYEG